MAVSGKSPAFQFYAAEWLADEHVRLMTLEQTGAYIDALAICWREGSIPACPDMLARLIGKGCTREIAAHVQLRFNLSSTGQLNGEVRLEHKRLNLEREKQRIRSAQMSKAGKKSAALKAQVQVPDTTTVKVNSGSTQVQPKYNSSSSSSDEDARSACGADSAVAEGDVPSNSDQSPSGKPPRKRQERAQVGELKIPDRLKTPEFLTAWAEWEQHRREIKHPLKPTQAQKQINLFAKWGESRSVEAINYTVMKGWRGIAEPDGVPAERQKPRMPSFEEQLERGWNPQTGLGN